MSTRPGADPVVTLDLPRALSDPVLNALKAEPRSVDIRAQAPHFYRLAVRILALVEEEGMDDVLLDTLKKRALEIFNHAHNPRGALGEGVDFLRGLDESERQFFRAAHDSAKDARAWAESVKKNA
ncbi:DNA replication protein [Ascosphaera atra]|nr:DNA replication protein [Ascosphaera atra]